MVIFRRILAGQTEHIHRHHGQETELPQTPIDNAYGRFNPGSDSDDYAWENDLIAHPRMAPAHHVGK